MPVTYRKAVSSHFQQPTRSVFQYPSQCWQNQYLPFSTTNQITAFQYPSQKSKKSISSHFQQAIRSQYFSILPRSGKKSVSSHFQQPIRSQYYHIHLVWLESQCFPIQQTIWLQQFSILYSCHWFVMFGGYFKCEGPHFIQIFWISGQDTGEDTEKLGDNL